VFQVKIEGRNKEMLATACQQFLGKTEQEIQNVCCVFFDESIIVVV
jgi:flotillin